MMYTKTRPSKQGDRIRLYQSQQAAEGALGQDSERLFSVAVTLDKAGRRLYPTWICPQTFDPAWSTPAYVDADGIVTARAPIPRPLFLANSRPKTAAAKAVAHS